MHTLKNLTHAIILIIFFLTVGCGSTASTSSTMNTQLVISVESTNNGNRYRFNGMTTFTFNPNSTYDISLDQTTSNHPFYLSIHADRSTGLSEHLIFLPPETSITWQPESSQIGSVYAHCGVHPNMGNDVSLQIISSSTNY